MLSNAPLGRVACLWRYPIKSLAAEPLAEADVDIGGLRGDRMSALFVATPDRPRSGKPYRGKENELLHTVATARDAGEVARARDIDLEPRDAGPYFDLDPVSILFDTWLVGLERALATIVDPLRFRPNVFVRAAPDFLGAEADLVGRILRIGSARLRITQPITRCVTTTYDIATGVAEPRVLANLIAERKNQMGVYAAVAATGAMRAGDDVVLES